MEEISVDEPMRYGRIWYQVLFRPLLDRYGRGLDSFTRTSSTLLSRNKINFDIYFNIFEDISNTFGVRLMVGPTETDVSRVQLTPLTERRPPNGGPETPREDRLMHQTDR